MYIFLSTEDYGEGDVGHAPSYVWRSIIWGRSLLIKGLCKRVGTGGTILVFKDPWLPRPATFRPYCSTLDNPNLLVRDLINESRSGWNMQMVRELFNVADQQSICSLSISKFPKADSWMWHYTADGTYSVKSGYFVASQLDQFDPSPSKSWFAVWWKGFWKTSLPKKVLIFAWRGFHDALPTYAGLQKRKVVDHTNCPICGFSVDSNSHAVFLCRGFKKIWKELRVSMLNNLSMDISFKQIVLKASEILSRSEYELFLVAAWYIWSERNQIVHGRKANPSDVVVSQIFNAIEDTSNVIEPEYSDGEEAFQYYSFYKSESSKKWKAWYESDRPHPCEHTPSSAYPYDEEEEQSYNSFYQNSLDDYSWKPEYDYNPLYEWNCEEEDSWFSYNSQHL
ncbi:hypothetical protein G4B88_030791 [Cannabis sativa]|uniref:Reverse transcriptase zinc-binding domain-containing protein n=1 Tax=Cannabis sativa TaxID=3483 RepID=A0A7J6HAP8_CANSA|nr:hypothetical protein G4B88_030791 [Cannabis sativa]